MQLAQTITLRKAAAIIVICTVAFIAAGIAVGYLVFWRAYDQRPQVVREQEMFKAQVRANPDDVNAHLNLGWTYYQQGNKQMALREYQKALSLDKENVGAMYNIGLVEKDLKNYREAEIRMKAVLQKAPLHELASYTLAQIYRETKQYDRAREQYLQALKLSPGSANIMAELGMVYEAQGKKNEAIKQYREALRYVPDLKAARDGLNRLSK